MKKLIAALFTLVLLASLTACSSKPLVGVVDTHFDATPAEFLSIINEKANTEEVNFPLEPDSRGWYRSDKTSYFTFDTNDDGKITKIAFNYMTSFGATANDAFTAGYTLAVLPQMFGISNNADLLFDTFNLEGYLDFDSDSADFPPVCVSFVALNGGNMLTIKPLSAK